MRIAIRLGAEKLFPVAICALFLANLNTSVTASDSIPNFYKTLSPDCIVAVSAKYRSRGHRDDALRRIFVSFSELTLERESKREPFPASGWSSALYDLFFVHVAGDCENRTRWVQTLIDDYHGRFPDDAQLRISPDLRVAENFFVNFYFQRLKPMYRLSDCRLTIKNANSEENSDNMLWVLIDAQRDVQILTGTKNPQIFMERGTDSDEIVATFFDRCENRRKLIDIILDRAREISSDAASYRVDSLTPAAPISGQLRNSPIFLDTREGLQNYTPPRHDVR